MKHLSVRANNWFIFGVTLIALIGNGSSYAQRTCKTSAISEKPSIGANEVVSYGNIRTSKIIYGRVFDPAENPILTAIIDVFPDNNKNTKEFSHWSSYNSNDRIRSYHVDNNGFFCLGDLPNGNYILRIGTEQFAFKHLLIRVRNKKLGTAKLFNLILEPGT